MTTENDSFPSNISQPPALELENSTSLTSKLAELTDKNVLFLHYINQGLSTVEAYSKAGYKGSNHAAYELRSYLKPYIVSMLQGEGYGTKEGLLLKLKKLQEMPLESNTLKVKEAIELLKLEAKFQPKELKEAKPTITPIVINITSSSNIATDNTNKTIDITPLTPL